MPIEFREDRATRLEAELEALRTLCDGAAGSEQRLNLLKSLNHHVFLDAENQVVFESIRALSTSGSISAQRLAIHLNNRGFPDIDTDKYFKPLRLNRARRKTTSKDAL